MPYRIAMIRAANPAIPYQISMPPLGLGYIAAMLKREMRGIELSFHRTPESVLSVDPDMVMVSTATENWPESRQCAQAIKAKRDIPIIVGGMHITALPDVLPEEMDVGAIGEGEFTCLELVETIRNHGIDRERLREIKGICFHGEDGKIERSPARPYINPLDQLPFPDRDLLGDDWLTPRSRETHIMSSRGCPYTCHFCTATSWAKVRYFSPEYTLSEVEWVMARYNPEVVYFFDDLFVGHRKRFKEICELIKARGIHKKVRFRAYARVNLIDDELCTLLRDHSFDQIDLGVETHSEKVMEYYNKKGCSPELNDKALDLLAKYNISVGTNFIFGAPVETMDDMQTTLNFIRRNIDKMDRLSVGPLQAPPGSGIHQDVTMAGALDNVAFDWHRQINQPNTFHVGENGYMMLTETVTPEEFEGVMREAYNLQKEINLRGQIVDRDRKMHRMWQRLEATERELATLKGSSAVKMAMSLRRLKSKLTSKAAL